jgi:hypothetical protein
MHDVQMRGLRIVLAAFVLYVVLSTIWPVR